MISLMEVSVKMSLALALSDNPVTIGILVDLLSRSDELRFALRYFLVL